TDALNQLKREDPTFDWKVDREADITVMTGMGVLHLEVKQHRMERDFRLKVRVRQPRVSYRETLRRPVRVPRGECDRVIAGERLQVTLDFTFEPRPGENRCDNCEMPPGELTGRPQWELVRNAVLTSLQSGELGYPVTGVHAILNNAN